MPGFLPPFALPQDCHRDVPRSPFFVAGLVPSSRHQPSQSAFPAHAPRALTWGVQMMNPFTVSFSTYQQQVLPRSRPSRASHGRKPIRRGRCTSWGDLVLGAQADVAARLMGPWLRSELRQPFIMSRTRRARAANVGMTRLFVRSASDGCTLLMVNGANAVGRNTLSRSSISISSKTSLRSRALPAALMSWWSILSIERLRSARGLELGS